MVPQAQAPTKLSLVEKWMLGRAWTNLRIKVQEPGFTSSDSEILGQYGSENRNHSLRVQLERKERKSDQGLWAYHRASENASRLRFRGWDASSYFSLGFRG